MIRIGIVEDLADYRNLLKVLITHTPGMELSFIAGTAEEAIILLGGHTANICLVDIKLPGMPGPDLVKWMRENTPHTLCLMCTAYDEDEKVFQSLEAGAHGYILKSTSPSDIIKAIQELHEGGSPMSSQVARKVVQSFSKTPPAADSNTLTERENQVLSLLAKGLLYKEIAAQLLISIATVKRHCFNIYQKLHVKNRTEAVNKLR